MEFLQYHFIVKIHLQFLCPIYRFWIPFPFDQIIDPHPFRIELTAHNFHYLISGLLFVYFEIISQFMLICDYSIQVWWILTQITSDTEAQNWGYTIGIM